MGRRKVEREFLRPIEGPLVEWRLDDNPVETSAGVISDATEARSTTSAFEPFVTVEKLTAESSLHPIAFLETGLQRSRAVARITVPGAGVATGFMIGPDRLLTNNHVFGSADEAQGATVQFNFQTDLAGQPLETDDYTADPGTFFHTNEELDYSVVHVSGSPGDKWGFIELRPDLTVKATQDVAIIQHPGGQPKQIAIVDNEIEYVDDSVAQYLTDTLPASSGSPVFNNDWECVALHHSGGWFPQPSDNSTRFRNEGILISAILTDMPS
jgi:V8-like Glu-specific endopeptidase